MLKYYSDSDKKNPNNEVVLSVLPLFCTQDKV